MLLPDGHQPAVCANLPYSITTPLLVRVIETCQKATPIVLMVQKEVAERLTAKEATPEYGAITVFTSLHAKATILVDVGNECFMPRPSVTSSVIRLDRHKAEAGRDRLRPLALRLSRAAFAQRRKTVSNALSAGLGAPKELVAETLRQAGIDPSARGETLSPEQFLSLASEFAKHTM